jgi:hypothetical protein
MVCAQSGPMQNNGEVIVVAVVQRSICLSTAALPNERCIRQALFRMRLRRNGDRVLAAELRR